jgi:hypothetical protein
VGVWYLMITFGASFGFTVMGRDLLPGWSPTALICIGLVLCALYVRHAMAAENPILDLRLLRIETFRVGVAAGSLFRIGVGAVPFLLPLMFQLAYGMSAFQSGMITFVAAAGAISMKLGAAKMIRRFGFRRLLLVNGLVLNQGAQVAPDLTVVEIRSNNSEFNFRGTRFRVMH